MRGETLQHEMWINRRGVKASVIPTPKLLHRPLDHSGVDPKNDFWLI